MDYKGRIQNYVTDKQQNSTDSSPFFLTSVSAHWRVPYAFNAVEENFRGMNEGQNERKNDTYSGFLILDSNGLIG